MAGIPWSQYYKEKAAKAKTPEDRKYYLEHAKYHEKLEKERLKKERKTAKKIYKYWRARGKHKIAEQVEKRYADVAKAYTHAWKYKPEEQPETSPAPRETTSTSPAPSSPVVDKIPESGSEAVARAGVKTLQEAYTLGRQKALAEKYSQQARVYLDELKKSEAEIKKAPEGAKFVFTFGGKEVTLSKEEALKKLREEREKLTRAKEKLKEAKAESLEELEKLKLYIEELGETYKGYKGKIVTKKHKGRMHVVASAGATPSTIAQTMAESMDLKEGETKEFILKEAPKKDYLAEYRKRYRELSPTDQAIVRVAGATLGGLESWKLIVRAYTSKPEEYQKNLEEAGALGLKLRDDPALVKLMNFIEGPAGVPTLGFGLGYGMGKAGSYLGAKFGPQVAKLTASHPLISKGLKSAPWLFGAAVSVPEVKTIYEEVTAGEYETAEARALRLATAWVSTYAGAKLASAGKMKKIDLKPEKVNVHSIRKTSVKGLKDLRGRGIELKDVQKAKLIETYYKTPQGKTVKVKGYILKRVIDVNGAKRVSYIFYTPKQTVAGVKIKPSFKQVDMGTLAKIEHPKPKGDVLVRDVRHVLAGTKINLAKAENTILKRSIIKVNTRQYEKILDDAIVFTRYGKRTGLLDRAGSMSFKEVGKATDKAVKIIGSYTKGAGGGKIDYTYIEREVDERLLQQAFREFIKSTKGTVRIGKGVHGVRQIPDASKVLMQVETNVMKGLARVPTPMVPPIPAVPFLVQIGKVETKKGVKRVPKPKGITIPNIDNIVKYSIEQLPVQKPIPSQATKPKSKTIETQITKTVQTQLQKIKTPEAELTELPESIEVPAISESVMLPIIPPLPYAKLGRGKRSRESYVKVIQHVMADVEKLL